MAVVTIDEERCKGCTLCIRACPKNILEISKGKTNSKGYHAAEVTEMAKCIACKSCALTCPDVCIEIEK